MVFPLVSLCVTVRAWADRLLVTLLSESCFPLACCLGLVAPLLGQVPPVEDSNGVAVEVEAVGSAGALVVGGERSSGLGSVAAGTGEAGGWEGPGVVGIRYISSGPSLGV